MKFPKEIIVTMEGTADDEFLSVAQNIKAIAIVGEKVPAARYQLVDLIVVEAKAEFTRKK